VHDEHVPQPMHAPQRLRVELEQRISTHEETLWKAVRNAARRINASELRVHASTQWQGFLT
jgi:hypothetical protein